MALPLISARDAQARMAAGALLVDIRPADEHARERIAAARHLPLERLAAGALADAAGVVIFHCRSGQRTRLHAAQLRASTGAECLLLDGGLDGWKQAGLPVLRDATQPLELQRQVQIAAGSLVLLGLVLGGTVSPWFLGLSAFVGAGLVFAGLSGFCGMARLLLRMPWNRKAQAG